MAACFAQHSFKSSLSCSAPSLKTRSTFKREDCLLSPFLWTQRNVSYIEVSSVISSQDLTAFTLVRSLWIGGIARIRFRYLMWSELCQLDRLWSDLRVDQVVLMGKTLQTHVVRFPFPPCPCCRIREGGKKNLIWSNICDYWQSECLKWWHSISNPKSVTCLQWTWQHVKSFAALFAFSVEGFWTKPHEHSVYHCECLDMFSERFSQLLKLSQGFFNCSDLKFLFLNYSRCLWSFVWERFVVNSKTVPKPVPRKCYPLPVNTLLVTLASNPKKCQLHWSE